MGESGPVPGTSRVARQRNARAVAALARRGHVLTLVTAALMALALGSVAWYTPWPLWLPLLAALLLALLHGRQMTGLGWDMREADEHVRTMGSWEITGRTPAGDPVTMAGHMVYDRLADVGRLTRPVRIALDADDY